MMTPASIDQDYGIVIILMISLMILLLICGDIQPNPGPIQNQFTASFTNIRGLRTNWDYLEHNLTSSQPHVFCVSETFLNSKIDDALLAVPGYSFFRRDRPDDSSWGGLLVFCSDAVTASRMPDFEHQQYEFICLKLNLPGRLVFIFCVYRPPSDDDSMMSYLSILILSKNAIQCLKSLFVGT